MLKFLHGIYEWFEFMFVMFVLLFIVYACWFLAMAVFDTSVLLPVFIFGLAASVGLTVSNTYALARNYEKSAEDLALRIMKIGNEQFRMLITCIQAGIISLLLLPVKKTMAIEGAAIWEQVYFVVCMVVLFYIAMLILKVLAGTVMNIVILKGAISENGEITIHTLDTSRQGLLRRMKPALKLMFRHAEYMMDSEKDKEEMRRIKTIVNSE
ncbi:hypothetical protein [Deinococcus koreensis]|uniref:hypothetical protein n=1 Tax=Deinococcus koreensis TaxID=2054903 RepID=UPI0010575513|nr:hypothetical protein [Deinococcus koreensis]